MIYKKIELVLEKNDDFLVNLKFEVATARAEGAEVLCVAIAENLTDEEISKMKFSMVRSLRLMKQKRTIQFFAFSEDFEKQTTEAVFLLNKYSEWVKSDAEGKNSLYLKL